MGQASKPKACGGSRREAEATTNMYQTTCDRCVRRSACNEGRTCQAFSASAASKLYRSLRR
eukprot:526561-Prymnesium_polylepis.1